MGKLLLAIAISRRSNGLSPDRPRAHAAVTGNCLHARGVSNSGVHRPCVRAFISRSRRACGGTRCWPGSEVEHLTQPCVRAYGRQARPGQAGRRAGDWVRHREAARGPCRVGVAHVVHGSESVRGAGDRCDINDRAVRSERTMNASFTAAAAQGRTSCMVARPGPGHEISGAPHPRAPAGHGSAVHGIIVVYLGR